jgi:hypothetical protein
LARDEPERRRQIIETVERTVTEAVERRLTVDSRIARHLSGHIRSQLYQDLVLERERLGIA